MRHLRHLLIFTLTALIAVPSAVTGAARADYATSYAAGRADRIAGRLDDAERKLNLALQAKPNDYYALYNIGLVYIARGQKLPAGPVRQQDFRTAAQWLQKAANNTANVPASDLTIYNSLGYVYIEEGDLVGAKAILQAGLKHQSQLPRESQGKLLANLGYVEALLGDNTGAAAYLRKAQGLGNTSATANLTRLTASAE